jgi:hypothetical protein
MDSYSRDQTDVDEDLWLAWVQRGKVRGAAATRKLKAVAGLAIGLLESATGLYLVVAK